MSAVIAAPETLATTSPATYTGTLLAFLNVVLLRAAPGTLLFDFGGGTQRAEVRCPTPRPMTVLPAPVLAALEANWSVRVAPALLDDACREPVTAAVLFARFRPPVSFDADRGGYHVVKPDAAPIRDALAGFLPPAFLVDGMGDVVAVYPLAHPLRDVARARTLQRRLAERLGAATAADVEMTPRPLMSGPEFAPHVSRMLPADDPGSLIAVAGPWTNSGSAPRWVSITALDTERRCDIDEIDATLVVTDAPETLTRKKGRP